MPQEHEPLLLFDIHHSGYLGWGVWVHQDAPEHWTAETVERLMKSLGYKMGLNLGAQSYEQNPRLCRRIVKWLEMFPGRIFLTGGDYAQLTACVRTGESNLRQIIVGLDETKKALNMRPFIWTMSEPGNFAQLPQVLIDLGYTGALLRVHGPGQRGSLTTTLDAGSVWWEGPDGTRILAIPEYEDDRAEPRATCPQSMWMMTRYRNEQLSNGGYSLNDLWEWKQSNASKGIAPVVMSKDDDHNNQPGSDNQCMTSGHLLACDTEGDARFRWVNADELFSELPEPTIVYTPEPERFETRVNSFCDYGYDSNSDWTIDLDTEAKLRMADFLSVLALKFGHEVDVEREIGLAWKQHLAAQNHDISLKSTLQLYHHLQYDAQRTADAARDTILDVLTPNIPTASAASSNNESTSIIAFNSLGWNRKDYATIDLPADIAANSTLYDGDRHLPWDVVSQQAELTTMGFVADVPSLGYRTYRLRPGTTPPPPPDIDLDGTTVNTSHYIVRFNDRGGITRLIPSGTNQSVVDSCCLARDVGGNAWKSIGCLKFQRDGLSILAIEQGNMGTSHTYKLVYRMTPAIPYIAISVRIDPCFVRSSPRETLDDPKRKIAFTANLNSHLSPITCMRNQPMLVGEYDPEFDPVFAALYWVDYGYPDSGLSILNRGVIGQHWDTATNAVSSIIGTGTTRGASQDLALLPRSTDLCDAHIHRHGLSYGMPFHSIHEASHEGSLAPKAGVADIQPENVTPGSTFVKNHQAYLRIWEHAGEPAEIKLSQSDQKLQIERVSSNLAPRDGGASLHPHQIATFRLP